MTTVEPNGTFKAIYNPYLRHLVVLYGDTISEHHFEAEEEWCEIYFNGDVEHPNYLHIQLDYDESMQLLFYPRVEGTPHLNESLGTYYYTTEVNKVPEQLRIVHNDDEFDEAYKSFLGGFK